MWILRSTKSLERKRAVYGDLRNIVMKTAGLAGVVRDVLQGPDIEIAFLFGSLAADTARPDSDVDLMVIGPLGLRHLSRRLSGLGSKLGREINPHVITRQEFGRRKRMGDHFVTTALAAPRIFILGTEDELTGYSTARPSIQIVNGSPPHESNDRLRASM